jgi:uncharacterized protein YqjF (DUF2071 family)
MWITRQRWEDLYFAHFVGPADLVRRALPPELELDLWQGEAVLSVVPFHMSRVRFPFLPPRDLAFERWATERYCLFNVWKGGVVRGDVEHLPWQLETARLETWEGNFLDLVPGTQNEFRYLSGSYSECLDVSFSPFERNA